MRTKEINVTGNPNFRYKKEGTTTVRDTIRKWQKDYERSWEEAHLENQARDAAEREVKVVAINVKGAPQRLDDQTRNQPGWDRSNS